MDRHSPKVYGLVNKGWLALLLFVFRSLLIPRFQAWLSSEFYRLRFYARAYCEFIFAVYRLTAFTLLQLDPLPFITKSSSHLRSLRVRSLVFYMERKCVDRLVSIYIAMDPRESHPRNSLRSHIFNKRIHGNRIRTILNQETLIFSILYLITVGWCPTYWIKTETRSIYFTFPFLHILQWNDCEMDVTHKIEKPVDTESVSNRPRVNTSNCWPGKCNWHRWRGSKCLSITDNCSVVKWRHANSLSLVTESLVPDHCGGNPTPLSGTVLTNVIFTFVIFNKR